MNHHNLLAIVGPTGIGKTEVAVAIARKLSAEIVVVDSMQVYRGMDIGTGKPPISVRTEIPHHGLDLVEPEEEFDVLRYVQEIKPLLEEVQSKGRRTVLVGGCGLYLKVLLEGLCHAPGRDPLLRDRLTAEGKRMSSGVLHKRLEAVDPESAQRIHPNDLRRIVRALEVYHLTGRPMTLWQKETVPFLDSLKDCPVFGLTRDRNRLYERIQARVDGWISAGWVDEARALFARPLSPTAQGALGYRELFDHFRGRTDWTATQALIHQNTRQYAKRQWSWFRQDPRVRWTSVDGQHPEAVAAEILSLADVA